MADAASRWPFLSLFYGPSGLTPRDLWATHFAGYPLWSLFGHLPVTAATFYSAALIQVLAGLALAVGFRPRIAAFLGWVLILSWQRRNPLVSYGVDTFLALQLLWCALLGLRPGRFMSVLWLLQWVCLYGFAAWATVQRTSWQLAEPLAFVLQSPWRTPWAELAHDPFLVKILTWGTLAVEGTVAAFVLGFFPLRTLRSFLLFLIIALHAAMVPLLGLWQLCAVSVTACLSLMDFSRARPQPLRHGVPLKIIATLLLVGTLCTNLIAIESPARPVVRQYMPQTMSGIWTALGIGPSWHMFSDAWPDPLNSALRITAKAGKSPPFVLEDFLGSVRGTVAVRSLRKPWHSFAVPSAMEALCSAGAETLERVELWEKEKQVGAKSCAP